MELENNTQIQNNNRQLEKIKPGSITSLELLEQINFFRKKEGNKTELQHYNLLKIIRDEFEEEINAVKIYAVDYTDKKGEKRPMYILSYEQGKQVLMRESKFVRKRVIEYIKKLEEKLKEEQESYGELERLYIRLHKTKNHLELKEITEKIVLLETRELKKEIEHKTTVITGLTHGIAEKDKRTIINQVIRRKGVEFTAERWHTLYYEFEKVGRYNLKTRIKNFENKSGKKISRIDYIEKELHQMDLLFQIACKLFESDINEIIEQYKKIR